MYKIINRKKRFLTILSDWIGNAITFPFRLFLLKQVSILPENIQRILLVRTAYLGDVIMTLPILKPLKEQFPKASITVLTSHGGREILLNNPYVDDVMVYEPFWFYKTTVKDYLKFFSRIRKDRFDITIEARADIRDILFLVFPARSKVKLSYAVGGGRCFLTHVAPYEGRKHKVEYHLDLVRYLGGRTDSIQWGIWLTEAEKEDVAQLLRKSGVSEPYLCVHPGGRLPLKRWPCDRWAILCDRMIDRFQLPLLLLSAGTEIGLVREITGLMRNRPIILAGETTIRQLSGVIAQASLLVCNDSAPMHIAAALGTPTVAIFGPSKSVETGPYGRNHLVVEETFACRASCDESRCTNKHHHACMESISLEDVFEGVEQQMGRMKTMATKNDLKKRDSASQIHCSINRGADCLHKECKG